MKNHDAALDRLRGLQIDTLLAGANMDAMRERFDKLGNRHEDGTAPRAVSAFNLFQTPKELAARLVGLLPLSTGKPRVLEPSVGLGRLLDCIPPFCDVVAVEHAPQIAAEIFRQDRSNVQLVQRDFLACSVGEFGLFDAVAMNPPFHMRADVRHILHAVKFLKPGGVLAALCLNTHHRATALRHLSSTWEELPTSTFAKEGTHVPTVLLTIKK